MRKRATERDVAPSRASNEHVGIYRHGAGWRAVVSCGSKSPQVTRHFPHDTPFAELVTHFVNHRHNYVYVVDNENRFLGAVSLHDIKGSMADASLARLVIASELMDPDFPFLELDSTVGVALDMLMRHYGERLPVVDGHGGRMLVGTLSKRDLLLTVGMRR